MHAGGLNAKIACSPGVEICSPACMQKMLPGLKAEIACWRRGEKVKFAFRLECKKCIQARRKRYTK
jgi:hypothetical protein